MAPVASIGSAAMTEAWELGHGACGEEHLLLAWVAADLPPQQRHELDRRGLTADAVRSALCAIGCDPPLSMQARGGTWSAPSWHTALGRAAGLSLAASAYPPAAADVARASVWEEHGRAAALLAAIDRTRDDVLAAAGPLSPHRPHEILLALAEAEAHALGDGYVGPVHVLLAVLAGGPDGVAAGVLDGCGITHGDVVARHRGTEWSPSPRPRPNDEPAAPSPATRQLLGRAQGLAAAEGAESVASTHALVGWLWQDQGQGEVELEGLGTTAGLVLDALASAAAMVPAVTPPAPDRREWGEPLVFPLDRLADVKAALLDALPPGSWGWNVGEDEAWAIAVAGIDLTLVLGELLDVA